jgi:hypothetical protein
MVGGDGRKMEITPEEKLWMQEADAVIMDFAGEVAAKRIEEALKTIEFMTGNLKKDHEKKVDRLTAKVENMVYDTVGKK